MKNKEEINFEQFLEIEEKLQIQMGQIMLVEEVPKSNKLLKLTVAFGPEDTDEKIVVTNIGDKVEPDSLLGSTLPFIMNLAPVKMMGIESQAMIMVGENLKGELETSTYSAGSQIL